WHRRTRNGVARMAAVHWPPSPNNVPPSAPTEGVPPTACTPAPLFRRFLAYLIDAVAYLALSIPFWFMVGVVLTLLRIPTQALASADRVLGMVLFTALTAL